MANPKRKVNQELRDKIRELLPTHSLREIAVLVGRSHSRVREIIHELPVSQRVRYCRCCKQKILNRKPE